MLVEGKDEEVGRLCTERRRCFMVDCLWKRGLMTRYKIKKSILSRVTSIPSPTKTWGGKTVRDLCKNEYCFYTLT